MDSLANLIPSAKFLAMASPTRETELYYQRTLARLKVETAEFWANVYREPSAPLDPVPFYQGRTHMESYHHSPERG